MNEDIRRAREAALAILQPSSRDLEHGFELHRQFLVVEPYGLGLQAPIDPAIVNRAVDEGASPDEFKDLYGEMTVTGWTSEELRDEYREAWDASGVDCIFVNSGEEGNNPLRLLKRLARYTSVIDRMGDFLKRIVTVEDIRCAKKEGRRCLAFALNGVPLPGEFRSVEDELRYIRVFAQLGAKAMHLTYNRRNPIGDGCGEPSDGGLSDFGRFVVKEMNRLGIIIDLAHTGWKTSLDAAKESQRPVMVSHSAAWALNAHIRCKPDEVIRAVLDTGGTMGITNVPAFLGGGGDINAFLDHIDYVARKFGTEAIMIGTDRAYVSPRMEAAVQALKPHARGRLGWESLWPANDPVFSPDWHQPHQMQSLAWTNWPLFTVGLVQRGYSDEAIKGILGENILRVAQAVWV